MRKGQCYFGMEGDCEGYTALWEPDLEELLASGLWLLAKTGLPSGPAGDPIEPEASSQQLCSAVRRNSGKPFTIQASARL